MRMTVTGWDRNHGEKEIFDSAGDSRKPGWLQVDAVVGGELSRPSAIVSHVAPMKLDGNYLVRMTLEPSEILHLFYKTHGHLPLMGLVEILSECQKQDEASKSKPPAKPLRRL